MLSWLVMLAVHAAMVSNWCCFSGKREAPGGCRECGSSFFVNPIKKRLHKTLSSNHALQKNDQALFLFCWVTGFPFLSLPILMSRNSTATLALALCGTFINLIAAIHLLSLWKSLRWETESEWEGSEKYRLDGVRIVWCLLSAYFSVASMACMIGLIGVVKVRDHPDSVSHFVSHSVLLQRIPSYVRLYRDYSVADLCFCALSTICFALASFRPFVRSAVCEELSRQPDLMRDLADAGLNLENCESWFERAVVASVGLMGVLLVVRVSPPIPLTQILSSLTRLFNIASVYPHNIKLPYPITPLHSERRSA